MTDPYGRFATLTYTDAGQLASITDGLGLRSSFIYGSGDFAASMTTPYGTTRFAHETGGDTEVFRRIEATDPLGATERVEYHWVDAPALATAPAGEVPTGFAAHNVDLDRYNSYYWDKRAMATSAGDPSVATVTHWLMSNEIGYLPSFTVVNPSASVPHSVKRPLEHRVWYAYADQDAAGRNVGSFNQPTAVARVLDDGTSQIVSATYNAYRAGHQPQRPDGPSDDLHVRRERHRPSRSAANDERRQ